MRQTHVFENLLIDSFLALVTGLRFAILTYPWVLFRHQRRILRSEWAACLIIACVRRCPITGSGRIFQHMSNMINFHKFADSRRKNKFDSASLTPKNRSTVRNESPCSYNYLLLHEGSMRVGGNKVGHAGRWSERLDLDSWKVRLRCTLLLWRIDRGKSQPAGNWRCMSVTLLQPEQPTPSPVIFGEASDERKVFDKARVRTLDDD